MLIRQFLEITFIENQCKIKKIVRDHSFSTYVKFSEKLTLTEKLTYVRVSSCKKC